MHPFTGLAGNVSSFEDTDAQLTDLSGNSLGVCSSAIIGGGSTDENGNPVAVLGTNFLRAFYSVFEVNSAAGTAQVCHGPPL